MKSMIRKMMDSFLDPLFLNVSSSDYVQINSLSYQWIECMQMESMSLNHPRRWMRLNFLSIAYSYVNLFHYCSTQVHITVQNKEMIFVTEWKITIETDKLVLC